MSFMALDVSQSKQKTEVAWARGSCCLHCYKQPPLLLRSYLCESDRTVHRRVIHVSFAPFRQFPSSLADSLQEVTVPGDQILQISLLFNIIGNVWDNVGTQLNTMYNRHVTNYIFKKPI